MMTQIEDQTSADRELRIEVLRVPEELDLASADGLAEQAYAANNENIANRRSGLADAGVFDYRRRARAPRTDSRAFVRRERQATKWWFSPQSVSVPRGTAAAGAPDGSLSIEPWLMLLCRDGSTRYGVPSGNHSPEGTDNQAPVFTPCG